MNERTYRREDIERSRRQWADFSDEWAEYRSIAARSGILFPPDGTKWDTWEDDEPSQRAILIRAIRETPELLRAAIIGAPSWGVVVRRLLRGRDQMRDDANLRDKDDAWARRDELGPRQALQTVAEILSKMRDSVA